MFRVKGLWQRYMGNAEGLWGCPQKSIGIVTIQALGLGHLQGGWDGTVYFRGT